MTPERGGEATGYHACMTQERRLHIVAVSLLVLGIVVGAACWVLRGTAFWVLAGIAALFIVAGLVVATRASSLERKREEERDNKGGRP